MDKLLRFSVYLGAFIGPFSAQSVAVILPDVAETFSISVDQSALAILVYLLPFATLMLVSSRLVRSVRPRRVITTAYAVTFLGALTCALTSSWTVFLVGFLTMALANAFTLPVLQVILKQTVPAGRLGSAMGIYVAMQSLGLLSAPLVSGLAARVDWQTVYVVVLAAAAWILIVGVPDTGPPSDRGRSGRNPVPWRPTLLFILCSLVVGFSVFGLPAVASIHLEVRFDLDSTGRGLVVMCGGLAAFLFARFFGSLADRAGAGRVIAASTAAAALAVAVIPLMPTTWAVALCWAAALLSAQGIQVCLNLLVLATPRGDSVLSTVQAFRFFGSAFTPVAMIPLYATSAVWAFWLPALLLALILVVQVAGPGRPRAVDA